MNKKFANYIGYPLTALLATVMAVVYEIMIFPNAFAPAGINGLATIIQHVFNFSVGYMSFIVNIPLLICTFFLVGKEFTFKSLTYVVFFSLGTLFMQNGETDTEGFINLKNFVYESESVSKILAPLFSGVVCGTVYGLEVRQNSCTGGTDIIARMIRIKHPELNIMWVTFGLNCVVAVLSYFAYAENGVYNLEPVFLCVIYCFASAKTGDMILQGTKNALKFEVVTSSPEEISDEIINKLKHSATLVKATGMYTHTDKSLLICIVNKNQIVEFEDIIHKYPDTFAYLSSVNETVGNFKHIKNNKITKK